MVINEVVFLEGCKQLVDTVSTDVVLREKKRQNFELDKISDYSGRYGGRTVSASFAQ